MRPAMRDPWPTPADLAVPVLGPATVPSPLAARGDRFVPDGDRVLVAAGLADLAASRHDGAPASFERAGPRAALYFDPATLACGILTCGGLCPGLNNVVRAIVLALHYSYGVRRIVGFRYGYAGLDPRNGHAPVELRPETVTAIHEQGGTFLGTSRGPQDVGAMVDTLARLGIGVLFVLGGDGGLRGALAIHGEIARRGLRIAVVGVPKTIDNDLQWIAHSFGFATAVDAAQDVVQAAHAEARAAWNGIGIVKLMGRHAGFIAAHATLASADVNFCLVPEDPFVLDGPRGFLAALERRLAEKHHAVVVVAEGAGQDLIPGAARERDASGNVKPADVGLFLRDRVHRHFAARGTAVTIRYLDPSYAIRSLPANATDAQYCLVLGQHAVHAGLAGRTAVVVGSWNDCVVHVPIPLVVGRPRRLDPEGEDWRRVLETTGQPVMR